MLAPISVTITCTDCFKGVSFCSGNTDNRRVVYCKGTLKDVKDSFFSKLSRKKRIATENSLARQQFATFLVEHYNIDANALSIYCGEGDWGEKMRNCHPLTRGELTRLVEVAKSLSFEERKVLERQDSPLAQRPKWERHSAVQEVDF